MTAKSEDYQSEYFSDPEELKDEQAKDVFIQDLLSIAKAFLFP